MSNKKMLLLLAVVTSLNLYGCTRVTDEAKLAPGLLLEPAERPALPPGETLRGLPTSGLALTKVSEGFIDHLYNDAAGYCTVAYGHLIYKQRCEIEKLPDFKDGVTEPRGAQLLARDMMGAQFVVQIELTKDDPALFRELSDGQYGALCDFVFNAGGNAFRSSTLLKKIKARQFDEVPTQLRRWVNAGGKPWPGLVKRREAEIDLFFQGLPKPRAVPGADEPTAPLDIRQTES
jgi:lysozyme